MSSSSETRTVLSVPSGAINLSAIVFLKKIGRLQRPADQVPLEACQHFCLWIGYHLAPQAVSQKRGQCSQSPTESPICRPSPVTRWALVEAFLGLWIGISRDTRNEGE